MMHGFDPRQGFNTLEEFKMHQANRLNPGGKGTLSHKAKTFVKSFLALAAVLFLAGLVAGLIGLIDGASFVNVEGVVVETPYGVRRIEYEFGGETFQIIGSAARMTVGSTVNLQVNSANPENARTEAAAGNGQAVLWYLALLPVAGVVVSGAVFIIAHKREKTKWRIESA